MDQFELKDKFSYAFFEEFQFDPEFRALFEQMARGMTPYEVIEHLCKTKKESMSRLKDAISKSQIFIVDNNLANKPINYETKTINPCDS